LFAVLLYLIKFIVIKYKKVIEGFFKAMSDSVNTSLIIIVLSITIVTFLAYTTIFGYFAKFFSMPQTTAINWFTKHNYPKQMDYANIFGVIFTSWVAIVIFLILWKRKKS
jgi:hypothetical protein